MFELLAFIAVIIIVVVAIKLGQQDNSSTMTVKAFQTRENAPLPKRSEGLELSRQRAEKIGDTEAVQAIDNGTYKELMEQRAAKRQAASGIEYQNYDIAGINYRRGIVDYVGDSIGYLKPQPTNRHDPNAIAIYASDGHHLGYIREYETDDVRDLHLKFPIPVEVNIEECYDYDEDRRFFVGTVTIKYKTK